LKDIGDALVVRIVALEVDRAQRVTGDDPIAEAGCKALDLGFDGARAMPAARHWLT
jgi:hypothetical protein